MSTTETKPLNFIEQAIDEDLKNGRYDRVHTRFPPEPNGYLHIGHAKAICLNFGLATKYKGKCNLRLDDSNPLTEKQEYVDAIREDVNWLGFQWDGEYFASDYYEQLYQWAVNLIEKGKAYVCDLTLEEVRQHRAGWDKKGKESPHRNRSVEENLDLFHRMRNGEFPDGSRTLRAKIDMSHPNMNMRDPVLYRILREHHYRTGDEWCIYPTYDFTHGQSDSLEGITHSICTLEFEDHRPLYDWFIKELGIYAPRQIEFARLNLGYTVMSKRRLLELVREKLVNGWDDPRMPTICGLRRRGYTPESIRAFCDRIGVAKFNSLIDMTWLEEAVRDDLNRRAQRVMAVLRPLKIVIENYPADQVEEMEAVNNPEDASMGTRKVPFSRELYIEQTDFMEDPPKKFFRLAPGAEVRLRYAYIIKCEDVVKDPQTGEITELRCTYDPETRSGSAQAGRKVKGTIHWVSAAHAKTAEVRIYDRLLTKEEASDVEEGKDWKSLLNPNSLEVIENCLVEPFLANAQAGDSLQFERQGYFCADPDTTADKLVFNRTVSLRDTWAKIQQKEGKSR